MRRSTNEASEQAVATQPLHVQDGACKIAKNGRTTNGKRKSQSNGSITNDLNNHQPREHLNVAQAGSIEACAAILASIDERAYSRAVLRDADALLHRVVLPMSFPWFQSSEEEISQVIARDIDELNGIVTANEQHVPNGTCCSDDITASVRRTSDPGVLELTSFTQPLKRLVQPPFVGPTCPTDNPLHPGELSLRMFHDIRSRDRVKRELETRRRKRTYISFNIASTSSRSTIFDPHHETLQPLLLAAILPHEVFRGARTTKLNAEEIAAHFGSYDCRYGLAEQKDGIKRYRAGRTRKVWTKKVPSAFMPVSMLTGESMTPSTWRRPRDVRVGIRINGSLLATSTDPDRLEANEIIDDAIVAAYAVPDESSFIDRQLQCRLDVDSFLAASFTKGRALKAAQGVETLQITASVIYNESAVVLSVVPPVIDCFPSDGGMLYTTCTAPGAISRCPQADANEPISSVLDLTASNYKICTICWAPSFGKILENSECPLLSQCVGCGLVVHSQCYGGRNPLGFGWKCDACLEWTLENQGKDCNESIFKQHRWSISCSDCGIRGSSLIRRDDGKFVHNTCRIWKPPKPAAVARSCALCGTYSTFLVRCAARNCLVEFHPLCALIASNAADLQHQDPNRTPNVATSSAVQLDQFLCTQYRLAHLEVGSRASETVETVPVAFCGLHNRDRRDDLYGLPAGGKYLEGTMHIPPLLR
ncbi:hypothetical protein MPSEU_000905700 [Mayamaea pseudoterrestris]|nr:hypothetical protein MPSEU_000905700 [Mayamaea pseudoterrestris]